MARQLVRSVIVTCIATALAAPLTAQCARGFVPGAFQGGCDDAVYAGALLHSGDLVVGGAFTTAGGVAAARVARWDGAVWHALGAGFDGDVLALAVLDDGDLVAGGRFTTADGAPANGLARWDGQAWSAFGAGVGGTQAEVRALSAYPGGLFIGGRFASIDGVAASNIALWDGAAFAESGGGLDGPVNDIWSRAANDARAVGEFTAGFVNGGSPWTPFLSFPLGTAGACRAVESYPGGGLMIGGDFVLPLSSGNAVALTVLVAYFGTVGFGSAFQASSVRTMLRVPAANTVLIGGDITSAGGQPAGNLTSIDTNVWSVFGSGLDAPVEDLVLDAAGDVIVLGRFTTADGQPAGGVARLRSSCAPTWTSYAPGCAGAAGPVELEVAAAPMTGREFRGHTTGMASGSLGLAVTGVQRLSPGVSLFPTLPQAYAGCTVDVDFLLGEVLVPTNGAATSTVAIPGASWPQGFTFQHQVLTLELGAAGITGVASSDALELTVGAF